MHVPLSEDLKVKVDEWLLWDQVSYSSYHTSIGAVALKIVATYFACAT